MQLRTLVLAGIGLAGVYVALPERSPEPAAAAPVAVRSATIELPRRAPVNPPRSAALEIETELADDEEGVEDDDEPIDELPPLETQLRGLVRDVTTREPVPGATVVVTSPALVGEQVAISDEDGNWVIRPLPPGIYAVTYYYANASAEYRDILVTEHHVTVHHVELTTHVLAPPPPPDEPAIEPETGISISGAFEEEELVLE